MGMTINVIAQSGLWESIAMGSKACFYICSGIFEIVLIVRLLKSEVDDGKDD